MMKLAKNKYHKLSRVRRVRIEGGKIIFHTGLFQTWEIDSAHISSLTLRPVVSLFDEIAVIVEAEKDFFLREEVPGFHELSEVLDFNHIFGKDWYQRAESGETLVYNRDNEAEAAPSRRRVV